MQIANLDIRAIFTNFACLLCWGMVVGFHGAAIAENPAAEGEKVASEQDGKKISLLAWNVESGGADSAVIAKQLAELPGYDAYALSEVHPDDFAKFTAACGEKFKSVDSLSGNEDRLQIIFNAEKFELVRHAEIDRYGDHVLNKGNLRSPLMVHLRDRSDKTEFLLVVNHLARGNEKSRNEQAIGLREWARDQSLPCVTIGDFNFDFDFASERGNQGFVELLRDEIWTWAKPQKLVDTNWYDPDGDGKDNYADSMLDFAFVAGRAKTWKPVCQVVVRKGDFPDDKKTSDHRPIELILSP